MGKLIVVDKEELEMLLIPYDNIKLVGPNGRPIEIEYRFKGLDDEARLVITESE